MLISRLKHFPFSHFVRRFSYTAINKTEKQRLSFEDPESIYKGKKTWELGRAYLVFSLCGIKMLMENNQTMMKVGKMILGDKIFGKLMKPSIRNILLFAKFICQFFKNNNQISAKKCAKF